MRVFERAGNPRELGFAIVLAPNAVAALRELGIARAVLPRAIDVGVFDICRGDGRVLKRVRFGEGDAARSAVTLRPVLHGALLEAIGGDALTLGSPAEGFTIDGARVTLRCAGGVSATGDILIGADGAGSVIRRILHPDEAAPRASGYHALRGVRREAGQLGVDSAVYLADGVEAGFAKAGEGAVYWYVSLVDEFAANLPPGGAGLHAVVERCTRDLDDRFRAIARSTRLEDLRFEPLFVRAPLPSWGTGPVTLLGDAAHPVLPHTAQGAAQALEDAVALGLALGAGSERPGLQDAGPQDVAYKTRSGATKLFARGARGSSCASVHASRRGRRPAARCAGACASRSSGCCPEHSSSRRESAGARSASRAALSRDDLPRLAEAVDAEFDEVAGVQKDRLGLHPERHARGRTGADDVAGEQRHELADVADERRDAEDHVRRRAPLAELAVDRQPHAERLRIRNLVRRRQEGPDRRERVGALALHPLAAALHLKRALGIVVVEDVARDVGQRRGLGHVRRRRPMTTASSTSQSSFVPPRGMRTRIVGPAIAVVALKKMTGSRGVCAPVSSA